jgi:carbon monoxide dehydrogenase subunit G
VKLQHRATLDAPRDRVWALLMDVPRVAACVPGVEAVTPIGADVFGGRFRVAIGPVKLALDGKVELTERDDRSGRAVMHAGGTDTRLGGSVNAVVTLSLIAGEPTTIVIDSDVQILGRIGELGQPLIKRKADDIMSAFAQNLAGAMGAPAR